MLGSSWAILVCLGLVLLMPKSAVAATYYVDFDGGSDEAAGTSADKPFQRAPGDPMAMAQAKAVVLKPGDTVVFKGGVHYRGSLSVSCAGTATQRITYDGNTLGAFGDGRAILDGSDPITGWRRCTSAEDAGGHPLWQKLFRADVPTGAAALTSNLFAGDRMLCLAQHPTPSNFLMIDRHEEYRRFPAKDGDSTSLVDAQLAALNAEQLIGSYVHVYRTANDIDTRQITAYDPAAHKITFQALAKPPYSHQEGRYALVNCLHPLVLDHPGEYVIVEKPGPGGRFPIYLLPLDDRDPNESAISCSVREACFALATCDFVTIQGFHIRKYRSAVDRGWKIKTTSQGLTIRDNEISEIRSTGYGNALNLVHVDDLLVEGNFLHDCPKMRGIVTHTAQRPIYRNNRLHRMGRTPLVFYAATNGKIIGNEIRDCTGTHSNGVSVYVDCKDILLEGNRIFNSNVSFTCNDSTNISVINNVFDGADRAQPISFWQGVKGDVKIFNNVLVRGGKKSGLCFGGTGDKTGSSFAMKLMVKNNIMDGPPINIMNSKPWTKDIESSHNLYLDPPAGYVLGPNEKKANPEDIFANWEKRDYRLKPGSPALDAGTDAGIKCDLEGLVRPQGNGLDIGAYENKAAP